MKIEGLFLILNIVGGDVEVGLVIFEMVVLFLKLIVFLVLGGGYFIGVLIVVFIDYLFIVEIVTMIIYLICLIGFVIGVL